jgi:membrane associated rhomboid family serine protease
MRPIADRLTPTVKTVVIAQACIYFFYVFVRQSRPLVETHLAIGPGLFAGELWQPLTSLFVHVDFLGFVFDIIGLWFVGAFVERAQGTRRCFALFLVAGVLANVTLAAVWRLRGAGPIPYDDGAGYGVMALFVAFGRMHGRAQAQLFLTGLNIQARYLVLILIGWFVAANLARGNWAAIAAIAVACLIGYLGAAPGGLKEMWQVYKARRHRAQFGVLEGGRKSKKKYLN